MFTLSQQPMLYHGQAASRVNTNKEAFTVVPTFPINFNL